MTIMELAFPFSEGASIAELYTFTYTFYVLVASRSG